MRIFPYAFISLLLTCILCFTQVFAQSEMSIIKQLNEKDKEQVMNYARYLLLKSKETDLEKAKRLHKADNTIPSEATSQKIMEFSRFMMYQQKEDEEKIDQRPKTTIQVNKNWYDFGQVKEGEVVTRSFTIKNVGQQPLYISDVKMSCGCTSSDWSKEVIQPKESSIIKVRFDTAGKKGKHHKTITIQANTTPKNTVLFLSGNIN